MKMQQFRKVARAARRLMRDRRGATGVIIAFSIIPMIGAIGLGVDSARGYYVKYRLTEALDASTLAAAQKVDVDEQQAEFDMFFAANFRSLGPATNVETPDLVYNPATRMLTASVSATVPTTFMRVLGKETMTVEARTVVRSESKGMELVLVMDNTGSMRSGGKIDAMKGAARDLINILYGQDEELENFWVSLVPYTATVNIGRDHLDWLRLDFDETTQYPTGSTVWKGCVEARWDTGRDMTDDPPAIERWNEYYYEDTAHDGDNNWIREDGSLDIDESNGAQNDGTGPNLGCGPAITPLTAERSVILDRINEMLPWHRGGTMGNLGLVWGWRAISPRWRGEWDGIAETYLPLDYGTDDSRIFSQKVVVMLTDGVNQYYDHVGGYGRTDNDGDSDPFGSDYSAYDRVDAGRLGTTDVGDAVDEVDDRMEAACTAMKDEGIILYTITFQVNNPSTQDLFRRCATSPSHYFNSPSNAELARVFRVIAAELSNLRLAE